MAGPAPQPPPGERAVGLEFYATSPAGVGGTLKQTPEQFLVHEISAYPRPDPEGPFTVLRVASRDWEQHELAQRIASVLHLPPHAIDWAGTKDRRAVAERLLSYRGAPPERIDLPGVSLVEAYRARSGLVLGHHFGNAFEIRVPLAESTVEIARVEWPAVTAELRSLGGVPNLFGLQRFGEVRPVTHEVGRWLVRGDVPQAVETYLAAIPTGEEGPGAQARREYASHHDARRALGEFPAGFRFERTLLDHLARGHDPRQAIRALSRELRMLFVHAYQSLLFNRWVSARWAAGLSLTVPEPGDAVLRVARDGTVPGNVPIPVDVDNVPECRALVGRGRALLAGPLVGYETPPSSGAGGELLERILGEEQLRREDFRLPALPDVASRGTFRAVTVPVPPVSIAFESGGSPGAWFRFALPKGAYATILLREYLKSGAVPSAETPSKPAF